MNVRVAARHARAEVEPDVAEDDDRARGHVLARVVADTLDDGDRAGVANREPLTAEPAQKSCPPVAPYSAVLPTRQGSPASSGGGEITMRPPLIDLPT